MPEAITLGTSGGNKPITSMTLGTSGGNKDVVLGYVGTSGGNEVMFVPLNAVAAANQNDVGALGNHTFAPLTLTVTHGFGTYTYLWAIGVGSDVNFAISGSATSNTVTIEVTLVPPTSIVTGFITCTVTDTTSGYAVTTNTVTLIYQRT